MIPYQWDALNDRVAGAPPSHAIQNFRIAAGLEQGKFSSFEAYVEQAPSARFATEALERLIELHASRGDGLERGSSRVVISRGRRTALIGRWPRTCSPEDILEIAPRRRATSLCFLLPSACFALSTQPARADASRERQLHAKVPLTS